MFNNFLLIVGIAFPFLINALGALLVFFPLGKKGSNNTLAFSAGVMMGASFWSLLLPAFNTFKSSLSWYFFFPIVLGVALGGLFIVLVDFFFALNKGEKLKSNGKFFVAVTAHNFPEGLTVGFALGSLPIANALAVSFGIAIQNFPEGLAVALSYKEQNQSKTKSFKMGVLSAVIEPIGSVIGLTLSSALIVVQPFFLCLSAGAMIYVCVSELIPKGCNSEAGVWAFNFGFCLMTVLDMALG